MAITGQDAVRIIQHSLGGPLVNYTAPASSQEIALANDAGRYLMSMRPGGWRWASGARATLGFTASQSYITLPSDFHAFIGVPRITDPTDGYLEFTDLETLASYIATDPLVVGSYFYAALTYDSSGAGAPVARLELYPTPSETNASAVTLFYRRGWSAYPDPANTTAAKIPEWMEALFRRVLIAFARGAEDDYDVATMQHRYLAELMVSPEYQLAVAHDDSQQATLGRLMNGAAGGRRITYSRVEELLGPS